MMIIKAVVIILAVLIAGLLIFAANRPDKFRIERSINIQAPPEKIFALINDFRSWSLWSPYESKDPAMKKVHSGAPSGVGTVYEWDGNKNVGRGRMEITGSTPPSRVLIKLDFFAPFEGHNTAEFTLVPQGDTTNVVWAMYGPSAFISKLMGIFFNMDKLVGDDFQTGLENLKVLAEK